MAPPADCISMLQYVLSRRLRRRLQLMAVNAYRRFITFFYRPHGVLINSPDHVSLSYFHESLGIRLEVIDHGRIYTDNTCNISVISKHNLHPCTSWQYEYGTVLKDVQNYSLTHDIHFASLAKTYDLSVVSLLTGGSGNYNYYHWLFDVLSRYFLVQDYLDFSLLSVRYLVAALSHPFQTQSLSLLGIASTQCIDSSLYNHITASKLVVTSHPNPEPHSHQSWIIDRLRDAFLVHAEHLTPNLTSRFVFISRSDAAHQRTLVNEQELLDYLEPYGFRRYSLSSLSFQQQIGLFAHATVVIGVHGAGLANLSFATMGCVVFELFSESYQPDMYEKISCHNRLEYHKIVCHASSLSDSMTSNISISHRNISKILRRVDPLCL